MRPLETIGGRKFALVLFFGVLYTLLLVCGYIDATIYSSLQMVTVGAFIAGNVAQKYVDRNTQKPR